MSEQTNGWIEDGSYVHGSLSDGATVPALTLMTRSADGGLHRADHLMSSEQALTLGVALIQQASRA